MDEVSTSSEPPITLLERPFELELADGTRLVPRAEAAPARVEGDRNHAFTLADVRHAAGGEPFAGYHLVND